MKLQLKALRYGSHRKLHHTCLYLANVRQMAPPERQTSNSSLLLIYRPRKDERLSWPSWLTYSGRYAHISGRTSAADRAEAIRESSPVRDRRSNHWATQPTKIRRRSTLLSHRHSVVVKDLWLEDKDKDLSVYANWTTAGTLFAIKIKITCAQWNTEINLKLTSVGLFSKLFFAVASCADGGGRRIYGRHVIIHNGQFAECEVLENCQGHCGPTTRTSTGKLVLEDKNFPRELQHCRHPHEFPHLWENWSKVKQFWGRKTESNMQKNVFFYLELKAKPWIILLTDQRWLCFTCCEPIFTVVSYWTSSLY